MKTTTATIGFAVLFSIVSSSTSVLAPAFAQDRGAGGAAKTVKPQLDREQSEFVEYYLLSINKLSARIQADFGAFPPEMASPQAVLDLVTEFNSKWQTIQGKYPKFRPTEVREFTKAAVMLLVRGRGKTIPPEVEGNWLTKKFKSPAATDGWYLANTKGDTGMPEIKKILAMGLLDRAGQTELLAEISGHDFDYWKGKTELAFDPKTTIATDAQRSAVLQIVSNLKLAPDYTTIDLDSRIRTYQTLDELRKRGKNRISSAEMRSIDPFLKLVKTNLYDASIQKLRDPHSNRIKVEYFGREQDAFEVKKILLKTQKGHVLLLGKPGVGKTTLLKILSNAWASGDESFREEEAPIILELKLSSLTHPTDMTGAETIVTGAKALSKLLGRRVVLYVDEAHLVSEANRNALKDHLAEIILPGGREPMVQIVLSTTSREGAVFLQDAAWARRLTEHNLEEFTREQSEALIKKTYVPIWKRVHRSAGFEFDGVLPEAMDIAFAMGHIEQPHAGNPVSTMELLEAAIIDRLEQGALNEEKGTFQLAAKDVADYLKRKRKQKLVPGDPEFDTTWEKMKAEFNEVYGGNDYYKRALFPILKRHFQSAFRSKMTSIVQFGAPASGKSYSAQVMAKTLFNTEPLTINCGEYKNGGYELNKLIGSPRGVVGSTDPGAGAILTKYIRENPQGGIFLFEETDYCHKDITDFLTNMITDMSYTDGLGTRHFTDQFIIVQNSNQGQSLMLPKGQKNPMTWEEFETRRRAVLQTSKKDGEEYEEVRPEIMKEIYEGYMLTIMNNTRSRDGNHQEVDVTQELAKQLRRNHPIYLLPPNLADLKSAARAWIRSRIKEFKTMYGIELELDPEESDRIVDYSRYKFEQGYSYIESELNEKIGTILIDHSHERGKKIKAWAKDGKFFVEVEGKAVIEYEPKVTYAENRNPWGSNPQFMGRINNFASLMSEDLAGNIKQIQAMKRALKDKSVNWNRQIVMTQVGTSGNGKTEFFKVLANKLFGTPDALFSVSELSHEYDLAKYFRPPTGIVGSTDETEFERWFESRRQAGGGVVLFDELLSLSGLHQGDLSNRLTVLNRLYTFLDTGYLQLGNKIKDGRSFIIGVTGNSLQEFFAQVPDDPAAEVMVDRILQHLDTSTVLSYFSQKGFDPPKMRRLGAPDMIFVNGPLKRREAIEAGRKMVRKAMEEAKSKSHRSFEFDVNQQIIEEALNRLSTVKLGMAEVNKGIQKILIEPMNGILVDLPATKKLDVKIEGDQLVWYADGKPVYFQGRRLYEESDLKEESWAEGKFDEKVNAEKRAQEQRAGELSDGTPQFKQLKSQKQEYSEQSLRVVTSHEIYGHWMVRTLLRKKNMDDAISLIPGDGHGGYVLHKAEENLEFPTLTSILEDTMIMVAGHRAVVISEGISATGGGTHKRDPNQSPNDDLGKVYESFDKIINNHLIISLSEVTPAPMKQNVKYKLERVITLATDDLIRKGLDSKKFEPIFKQGLERRFILAKDLDVFVEKLDFTGVGAHPDLLALEVFVEAMRKSVDAGYLGEKDLPWIDDMMTAMFHEYKAKVPAGQTIVERFTVEWDEYRRNGANWKKNCNVFLSDASDSDDTAAESTASGPNTPSSN